VVNPYESPTEAKYTDSPRQPWLLRGVFFCINSLVALLFLVSGIATPFVSSPRQSAIGALCAVIAVAPSTVYLVAECLAFLGRRKPIERVLGMLNLIAAGFVVLGLVANLAEFFQSTRPDRPATDWSFLTVFVPIASLVGIYLGTCGYLRLRWTKKVERNTTLRSSG
jgi:hypothetical protein